MQYPADLTTTISNSELNIKNKAGDFDLVIASEPTNLDLSNYVDQKSWCTSIKSSSGKTHTIDSENSLRFEKNPCGLAGSTDIYTVHNGTAYHFSIDTQETYEQNLPTLNQILSTFKFTDYSLAIDTSDWKTYVNNETGYSLKYPQDWKIIDPCHKGSILTDSLCFVSSDYIASTSPALTEKGSEITLFKGELIPFSPETVNCDSYSDNNSCEAKNYGNFTVLFKQDNKNPNFREITIQNNSNYKMIGLYVKYNPQSKEITNNIFNSMLSTFRFD